MSSPSSLPNWSPNELYPLASVSHMLTTSTTQSPKIHVDNLSSSLQHFGFVDYVVFILMLVICAIIGFYFGFIEKKDKTQKYNGNENCDTHIGEAELDYFVGGRTMKVFPVAMSLVASCISGISLLGTSTEVYVYGIHYALILISLAMSGVITWYVFLPVFCNLKLTSAYEYFELRFNKNIRVLGSIFFSLGTLIWLPIVIYVPALAFNQVTGINIHVVTPVVCLVCIFYTTVGGLKAVVWTDVIQTFIMVGAIVMVIVKGTIDVGGLDVVWRRNIETERLEWPKWTFDHTERISIFSMLFGAVFHTTQSIAGNQSMVQRFFALPGMKEVKWALIWFIVGVIFLSSLCIYNGLLLYATYHDCDPLTTKLAKAKDQLVPLLVMDILRDFPGVPGMFVAGVFSAALSSLSTGLNSLAVVCLEDYIKPLVKTPLTQSQTMLISRLLVVLMGILCVSLVFVVENLGSHVIQISITFGSITTGPLLGLFFTGLMMPKINSKSALTGCLLSFFLMAAICGRAQMAINTGELIHPEKQVFTDGCTYLFDEIKITTRNTTMIGPTNRNFAQHFYHMSIFFYALFGGVLTTIFAYLSSFIFGQNDITKMNPNLFAPFIRSWLQSSYGNSSKQVDSISLELEDTKT